MNPIDIELAAKKAADKVCGDLLIDHIKMITITREAIESATSASDHTLGNLFFVSNETIAKEDFVSFQWSYENGETADKVQDVTVHEVIINGTDAIAQVYFADDWFLFGVLLDPIPDVLQPGIFIGELLVAGVTGSIFIEYKSGKKINPIYLP